jgi:hypothetical protein
MDPEMVNLDNSSSSAGNSDPCDKEEFSNDNLSKEL